MNIFRIMERGNSSVREVTFTAWLSYFLDPSEDHSMHDSVLARFLNLINFSLEDTDKNLQTYLDKKGEDYSVEVIPEYRPEPNHDSDGDEKKGIIDVAIKLFAYNKKGEIDLQQSLIIYVELKVGVGALRNGQLLSYASYLEQEEINNKYLCLLTPDDVRKDAEKGKFEREFSEIKKIFPNCSWIKWKDNKTTDAQQQRESIELRKSKSVLELFQQLLEEESNGKISPFNEYSKHTLKALIYFIDNHPSFSIKCIESNKDIARYKTKIHDFGLAPKIEHLSKEIALFLEEELGHTVDIDYDLNNYSEKGLTFLNIKIPQISNNFIISLNVSVRLKPTVGMVITTPTNSKSDREKVLFTGELDNLLSITCSGAPLKSNNSTRAYFRFTGERAVSYEDCVKIEERLSKYVEALSLLEKLFTDNEVKLKNL